MWRKKNPNHSKMSLLCYICQSLHVQNRFILLCISFWQIPGEGRRQKEVIGSFFIFSDRGWEGSGAGWGENCGHRQACFVSLQRHTFCAVSPLSSVHFFGSGLLWLKQCLTCLTVCPLTFIPDLHRNKESIKCQKIHNSYISHYISASLNI